MMPFVWQRFTARLVDQVVFWYMIIFISKKFLGPIDSYEEISVTFVIAELLFIPAEACQLYLFRKTLGKALFGITIDVQLTKKKFSLLFHRSFLVWWRGQAAGIPILVIIALGMAYSRYIETGTTTWDSDLGTSVNKQAKVDHELP